MLFFFCTPLFEAILQANITGMRVLIFLPLIASFLSYNSGMDISHLLIYGIAVWRIASLFVNEDGPGFVFRHIREFAGITHDDGGNVFEIPDNFWAQLLSCVWCFSVWVSFFMTIFWLASPFWSLRFAVIFAFSGVAILVDKVINFK